MTVSVPRQSGKTHAVFDIMGTRSIAQAALCWYTADTGQKARRRWRGWVEALPRHLRPKGSIRWSNGDEAWKARGIVRPFAPNRDAVHGEQSDMAVVDEGWSHLPDDGDALLTAIKPTQQTRQAPQVWILSAAGDYRSTWWEDLCEQGRAGTPGHAHFEWGAPTDEDVFDPDTWPLWHPGVGHLFTLDTVPDLLTGIGRDDAIRSYGNRRRDVIVSKWPPGAWEAGAVELDALPPVAALALDVAPGRDSASIAAAHALPDGRVLTQLLAVGPGESWLELEATQLAARIGGRPRLIFDGKAQAGDVVEAWSPQARRVFALEPIRDATGYGRACSGYFSAVIEGRAVYLESGDLTASAVAGVSRPMADTWAWSRTKTPGDATPLVAASLAWWAVARSRPAAPTVRSRPGR